MLMHSQVDEKHNFSKMDHNRCTFSSTKLYLELQLDSRAICEFTNELARSFLMMKEVYYSAYRLSISMTFMSRTAMLWNAMQTFDS